MRTGIKPVQPDRQSSRLSLHQRTTKTIIVQNKLVRPVGFEPTKAMSKTLPHPAQRRGLPIPLTIAI